VISEKLYLSDEQPGEEAPYERLLGAAMAGDGALFTREGRGGGCLGRSSIRFLGTTDRCAISAPQLGPKEADALITTDDDWHNPTPDKERK